jgi:hypothetical protein
VQPITPTIYADHSRTLIRNVTIVVPTSHVDNGNAAEQQI